MLYRGTCFHWVFFVRLGGVGPCRTPYDGTVGFSLRSMEVKYNSIVIVFWLQKIRIGWKGLRERIVRCMD